MSTFWSDVGDPGMIMQATGKAPEEKTSNRPSTGIDRSMLLTTGTLIKPLIEHAPSLGCSVCVCVDSLNLISATVTTEFSTNYVLKINVHYNLYSYPIPVRFT